MDDSLEDVEKKFNGSGFDVKHYLAKNIQFNFDNPKRKALDRFFKLRKEIGEGQ